MKIFITGADGQLAKSIAEVYAKEDIFLATRDLLDVTDGKKVSDMLSEHSPDIIFHFASLTRGDECARDPDGAYLVNVGGTKNVVAACRRVGATLCFVSTNEVFDGKKETAYVESDMPNPITVAGKTKHEAEQIISKGLEKHFIVRTSWLYNEWSHNFLHAILEKAKKEEEVSLVDDEVSSPTYSFDLAQAIKILVTTKQYGLYHLVNEGEASRLQFAKKMFDVRGLDPKIIPVGLNEFKRLSAPPLYSPLKNMKASALGITLPKWENALERFLTDKPNCLV